MKKNRTFHVLLITAVLIAIQASIPVAAADKIQNGVQIKAGELNVKAQFYADDMVRIVKWVSGGSPEKEQSLVVTKVLAGTLDVAVREDGGSVRLSTGALEVAVSKKTGNVQYLRPDGTVLLREHGRASLTPIKYGNDRGFTVSQDFELTPDEGVYGLGQHQDGYMNYRGKQVVLVQSNTDAVNPFLVSTRGYGILWDNYSKTVFDDHRDAASFWSDIGDNIDYYFIAGELIDEVIAGYRDLTGQAPLYGKWAYGYWQSKEHYEDRDELMSVARKYRDKKIPIDNIIQDWDYWDGQENWGQLFFAENKFPRGKEMLERLHDMNYHVMISVWPSFGQNTPVYKEMDKRGYLFWPIGWANFKYYDAYIPEANELYWKYAKEGLYSKGIDAWWIDSTEPDIINATAKDAQEFEMKKIGDNHFGSWARYLNTYSLAMTESIYKNQREESAKQRVYILTRSAFAGQQRAAATTWSGDIGASWDVYKKQITAGINFSMAGIPYWTFDIGAFALGGKDGVFTDGKDPAYQELYTRMFQFGAFCPIFRSHGSQTPREIWEFGEFQDELVKFDNLRYRLLPYIYSNAWKITHHGYTLMRGLAMDFADDRKTYDIGDQFMFGPAIMVNPVTEYQLYPPPEHSVLIEPKYFKTAAGRQGLQAQYYKDKDFKKPSLERVDPNINVRWYTGRPDYATDSEYAIRWKGKLVPDTSGKYQFHIKTYDPFKVFLNGEELPLAYSGMEKWTVVKELEAGKAYDFMMEVQNDSTGAARARLYWRTPEQFAAYAAKSKRKPARQVYLPSGVDWIDFWTGDTLKGGRTVTADAPIDKIPLLVKAGSIVPMGPFLEYSTEKPADPIELRIYPGADAEFVLYEDENDNYNYEKGVYATVRFTWNDKAKRLTIADRTGRFPGMLESRKFKIVLVRKNHGAGIDIEKHPDKVVEYSGKQVTVQL